MALFNELKYGLCVSVSLLIMLLVIGCEKNDLLNNSSAAFCISLNTKAMNGDRINNAPFSCVRLIVVEKSTSRIVFNESTDKGLESEDNLMFTLSVNSGEYMIYAISNETEQMKVALNKAKSLNNLKAVTISGEFDETNIPYSGSQDFILRKKNNAGVVSSEVSTNGGVTWNDNMEISLERTQCKVSLYLRKKTASTTEIKITKVELCNIPDQSYLISKAYEPLAPQNSTVFDNTTAITLDSDVPDGEEDLTSYSTIFDTGVIFPEKQMIDNADASKATYLKIYATYGAQQTTYVVKLRDDLTVENYDLSRNIHYKVYATLKSAGEVSAIYFTPIWTVAEVSGDIEVPYLNVSGTVFPINLYKDKNGNVTAEKGGIVPNDFNSTFHFWTNRPKEKVRISDVVYKDKGGEYPTTNTTTLLSFQKNTTNVDGVPDVAGKVDLGIVFPESLTNLFSTDPKRYDLTLYSEHLSRILSVEIRGFSVPNMVLSPSSNRDISCTLSGEVKRFTTNSLQIEIYHCPNFELDITATHGLVLTPEIINEVINADGTKLTTYKVTYTGDQNTEISTYPRGSVYASIKISLKGSSLAQSLEQDISLDIKRTN